MTLIGSALLSLVLVGVFVKLARRNGWGKAIRRDGPQAHLAKEGIPTMGGIAFLVAALLGWLLLGDQTNGAWVLVALTAATALLGWYDDLMSLRRKRRASEGEDASTGLLARYRLLLQAFFALLFAIYAVSAGQALFGIALLDVLVYTFIVVGSINAINFSDGVDGLAAGMVVIILLPFIMVAAIGSFAGALIGALLGFLWFNSHPARVIMGGVGSEALGAAVAGIAILAGWTWWLPLIALVPVLEVLSVIIQVSYFRRSGGKRFFKMSPLHHHFELSGWSESKVVMRFWLITALCVALAWALAGGAG